MCAHSHNLQYQKHHLQGSFLLEKPCMPLSGCCMWPQYPLIPGAGMWSSLHKATGCQVSKCLCVNSPKNLTGSALSSPIDDYTATQLADQRALIQKETPQHKSDLLLAASFLVSCFTVAAISEDNAEAVLGLTGCTFNLSGHVENDATLNGDKPGMPMVSFFLALTHRTGSMSGVADRCDARYCLPSSICNQAYFCGFRLPIDSSSCLYMFSCIPAILSSLPLFCKMGSTPGIIAV